MKNDTETLKWVAEHLVKFDVGFSTAEIEFIDNKGCNHKAKFYTDKNNVSYLEMLKGCINEALKVEYKDKSDFSI